MKSLLGGIIKKEPKFQSNITCCLFSTVSTWHYKCNCILCTRCFISLHSVGKLFHFNSILQIIWHHSYNFILIDVTTIITLTLIIKVKSARLPLRLTRLGCVYFTIIKYATNLLEILWMRVWLDDWTNIIRWNGHRVKKMWNEERGL